MSGVFDGARAGAQAGGAFSGAKANAGLSAESPKKKAEKARLRAESEKRFQGSTATAGVSTEKPKKGKTVDFPSGRSYQWDGSDQDAQRIKDAERYLMDETAMGRYSSKPPRREPGGNAQVLNSGVGQFGKFVTDLGNEVYDKTTTEGVKMGMTPSEKFIAGQGAGLLGGIAQAPFTALGGLLQVMGSDSTPEMRMKGGAESAFEIGGGALIGKLGGLLKKFKGGAKGAAEGVEATAKATDVPTPKPAVEATPTAPPKKGPKLKNSEKLVEDVTHSFREPTGKATLSKKSRDMMDKGEGITTNDNYTEAFQQSIDNLNGAKQTTKASPTISPEKEIAQLRTKAMRGQATEADRVRLRELEAPETVKMTSPSPVKETVTPKGGKDWRNTFFRGHDEGKPFGETETFLAETKDQAAPFASQKGGTVSGFRFKREPRVYEAEIPWDEYQRSWRNSALLKGYDVVPVVEPNGQTVSWAVRNKDILEVVEPSKPPTTPIAEAKGATTPAKGRSRPYMLGGQEGARATVTFADEAQQAWYDAAAKEFGARNKRYDLIGKGAQKPSRDAIEELARREGITPAEAYQKAQDIYNDVRAQMNGAKDGEARILINNVGKSAGRAPTPAFRGGKSGAVYVPSAKELKTSIKALRLANPKNRLMDVAGNFLSTLGETIVSTTDPIFDKVLFKGTSSPGMFQQAGAALKGGPSRWGEAIKKIWKEGDIDLLKKYNMQEAPSILKYAQRAAGMTDIPFKDFAYEATKRELQKLKDSGKIMFTDDVIDDVARDEAAKAVFMGDTPFTNFWRHVENGIQDYFGDKGSLALDNIAPFVRVISNVAGRTTDYLGGGGLVKGGVKAMKAETLAERREVVRLMSRGLWGGGLTLLGRQLYDEGKIEPKELNTKSGYADWGNKYGLGDPSQLGPIMAVVLWGAAERAIEKSSLSTKDKADMIGKIYMDAQLNSPAMTGVTRVADLRDQPLTVTGKVLSSALIPSLLATISDMTDLDSEGQPRKRKADGLIEPTMRRIPGVRNMLEEKDPPGPPKRPARPQRPPRPKRPS